MFFETTPQIPNQFVTQINGFSITIKREDLIHPLVSGNKFRKLKYNVQDAQAKKATALVTFGGAYSNHLAATAAAGKTLKIQTHGFVRGDELENKTRNPTLQFCEAQGMQLHFISRDAYRLKEKAEAFKAFLENNQAAYVIPEGGTNALAVKGCREILTTEDSNFTTICCAVGTGGTFSGLLQAAPEQEVLGFVVVQDPEITNTVTNFAGINKNWELVYDHGFGGYGAFPSELISFINGFYEKYKILLDPLYTGKMLFGIFTLIKNKQWRWGNNILIIHTGGIQGIQGANQRLEQQGKECIRY
tara:strand:+ start:5102 stop:6010 length:909 start_codon:yes stop_codon:yes gene_type:complete